MNWLMWFATVASLVGTVGVNRKRAWGQAVWLGTNAVWVACYLDLGLVQPALLFSVYFCLALYGFLTWRFEELLSDDEDQEGTT